MKAIFRPSGRTTNVFPVPPNDTPMGEFGSLTARVVGKRLAGPSRWSPVPSARTKKMPSAGGSGVTAGSNECCFVTSKTTPEPSGSTAMFWKTPVVRDPSSLRDLPRARQLPGGKGSGTGVGAATSMTVTGSQLPRRITSFWVTE